MQKRCNNALARNGSLTRIGHTPVGIDIDEHEGKSFLQFTTLVNVLLMYCL